MQRMFTRTFWICEFSTDDFIHNGKIGWLGEIEVMVNIATFQQYAKMENFTLKLVIELNLVSAPNRLLIKIINFEDRLQRNASSRMSKQFWSSVGIISNEMPLIDSATRHIYISKKHFLLGHTALIASTSHNDFFRFKI